MTPKCTCKAEHWQPHADGCPAKVERPLLTLENIRSGAVPSDAVAVGFLLGERESMEAQRDHWLEIAREKDAEIERLTEERDDAKADYFRVHRDYMNYRYGGSPPGTPPGRLADEPNCNAELGAPRGEAGDRAGPLVSPQPSVEIFYGTLTCRDPSDVTRTLWTRTSNWVEASDFTQRPQAGPALECTCKGKLNDDCPSCQALAKAMGLGQRTTADAEK